MIQGIPGRKTPRIKHPTIRALSEYASPAVRRSGRLNRLTKPSHVASLCCRTCYPRRRWRGCSIKAVRKRNKVLRLPVKPPTDFLAVLLRGSWRIRRDQRVSDDVHCYKYGAPANAFPLPCSIPCTSQTPALCYHPPTCSRSSHLASIACAGATTPIPVYPHTLNSLRGAHISYS